MRFAFLNADERNGQPGDEPAPDAEAHAETTLAVPLAAQPDALVAAAETLALYHEYLNELDNVPTLRDPVLPETSGQQLNLDEKIREVVRDELAKIQAADQEPKRGSARSRKRRKR
jgi:hypothetical protein